MSQKRKLTLSTEEDHAIALQWLDESDEDIEDSENSEVEDHLEIHPIESDVLHVRIHTE